ncbi:MAG TPA: 3-phosphoshikimate 1-carboxyvinyltransferase [bacterium]|nr:3-phosphoshikimate 1-carboxyvinyltransferase [bacterium]HMY36191.1 3-phosphoshikimate 1-carboxyvinyltransferase [bacterium]HMZ05498.1 3-phosphoshikimate 1-carboxyvinyltransferase [bacterium]HNB08493.1 3-phosphoshikimate 1-carboxyvinyltransferase [bacterium]HNB55470.1 3-phosphoshikimate 1-carboxyvinyltransferase [bacterium]
MATALIKPATKIRIDCRIPGDKSITHRAVIFSAMSESIVSLFNIATGADVQSTIDCMRRLGVKVDQNGSELHITGCGMHGFVAPSAPLYCGNSGTTARLLAGILSGQSFKSELSGDASLSRRPMRRIIEPLTQMGAKIKTSAHQTLPIEIEGTELKAIDYSLPIASAQVKSCILLAGHYAKGITTVRESVMTRDHTERLLPTIKKSVEDGRISLSVTGGESFRFDHMTIPGDLSSAAFLIATGLLLPESEVTIRHVSLNPTRIAFLEILKKMGADITIHNITEAREPYGDIVTRHTRELKSVQLSGSVVAALIDEIPILAVLGTHLKDGLEVRDARELRNKECDRIEAIVKNMRSMGIRIDEFDDGFRIYPGSFRSSEIDSFDDHRIAMAFTVAALIAEGGESIVHSAEAVRISFPEFYSTLNISLSSDRMAVHQ